VIKSEDWTPFDDDCDEDVLEKELETESDEVPLEGNVPDEEDCEVDVLEKEFETESDKVPVGGKDPDDDVDETEPLDEDMEFFISLWKVSSLTPRKSAVTLESPLAASAASSRMTDPGKGCPLLCPLQSLK